MSQNTHEDGRHKSDEGSSVAAADPGFAEHSEAIPDSAPANPSNTAGANCTIYRVGIDSLYLSYPGQLSEIWAKILDSKKDEARAIRDRTKAHAWVSLLDHNFEVEAFGRKVYRYVLSDNAYRIEVAGFGAKTVPLAYCRISSEWLTHVGVDKSVSQLSLIIAALGDCFGAPAVARADLFADFTAPYAIDSWPRHAWVTRARSVACHYVGDHPSGWSVGGGGPLMARLYDKLLELDKSGKHYLKALWHQAGWEPDLPVFRLEFQFRRDALRELGVSIFPELLANCGRLWGYATQDWLRLCIPSDTDTTKSRWDLHPLWTALQPAQWNGQGKAERIHARIDRAPADGKLTSAYVAVLSSYMAAKGVRDPLEAADQLDQLARHCLDSYAFMSGLRFEEIVKDRAARKSKQYNRPMVGDGGGVVEAQAAAYRRAKDGV